MRYLAIKADRAREILEKLRAGEPVDEEREVEIRGSGEDVEPRLVELARKLDEIRSNYPPVLKQRDPRGGAFEAEACVEVHRRLPFDPAMLADHDWWTWLAVFYFRELVDWRHGFEKRTAAPANFGIGARNENLLYRMWLRADIGYDPDRRDPYELARRGDQDFWRSHVLRQGYGRCRELVKALVIYQFSNSAQHGPTLRTDELRELAKRLRRIQANVMFECLDRDAALELVRSEAERAKRAVQERVLKA